MPLRPAPADTSARSCYSNRGCCGRDSVCNSVAAPEGQGHRERTEIHAPGAGHGDSYRWQHWEINALQNNVKHSRCEANALKFATSEHTCRVTKKNQCTQKQTCRLWADGFQNSVHSTKIFPSATPVPDLLDRDRFRLAFIVGVGGQRIR